MGKAEPQPCGRRGTGRHTPEAPQPPSSLRSALGPVRPAGLGVGGRGAAPGTQGGGGATAALLPGRPRCLWRTGGTITTGCPSPGRTSTSWPLRRPWPGTGRRSYRWVASSGAPSTPWTHQAWLSIPPGPDTQSVLKTPGLKHRLRALAPHLRQLQTVQWLDPRPGWQVPLTPSVWNGGHLGARPVSRHVGVPRAGHPSQQRLPHLDLTLGDPAGCTLLSLGHSPAAPGASPAHSSLSLQPGQVVGIDVEWRPSFGTGDRPQASIMQVAVEGRAFLLDLAALSRPAVGQASQAFSRLVSRLLSDPSITKLGEQSPCPPRGGC